MYLCILEKCTFNGLHILYVVNRETGILYQIRGQADSVAEPSDCNKISLNM